MGSSSKPRMEDVRESLRPEEKIESLVREGRIAEAQDLLELSGDLVPAESQIRKLLGPPRVKRSTVLDVDRSPEYQWLRAHGDLNRGKWVALVGSRLVACSDTFKELLAQLAPLQFERKPLIHHLD